MKVNLEPVSLPLFPLNVVLYPNARLPLHIFEERYKLMMKHVLSGTGQFGVVYCGEDGSRIAEVGCIAEVKETHTFIDGRMNVDTTGTKRFKIKRLESEHPFIMAEVETIEEDEVEPESYLFARELKECLDDVVKISSSINDLSLEVSDIWPDDPISLSYAVPEALYGDPVAKQSILEMESVNDRIKIELSFLNDARKYLVAQKALKDAIG